MAKLNEFIKKAPKSKCGEQTFPVLSITKANGLVLQSDRFKKQIASVDQSQYLIVKRGQLVLSIHLDDGVLGVQNVVDVGIVSPAYKIWDVNEKKVRSKYLEWLLKSPRCVDYYRSQAQSSVAGRCNVGDKDLLQLEIEVPDFETQDAALEQIDKAQRIINLYQQELETLDILIKARFVELFGEDIKNSNLTISDIAQETTVGIANSATHAYAKSGIVMLRNQNIRVNYLDDSDLIYIKQSFASKYKNKALQKDDILVTRTGANVGMACLVPSKYAGCQTFTTLILRLRKDIGISPVFVCYYINSPIGKVFVHENKIGGAQPNFGAKQLASMPIIIPLKEKQDDFENFVTQVDKSKFISPNSRQKGKYSI